jgi:hypothetical protein
MVVSVAPEELTPNQKRTRKARETFHKRFKTPEEKTDFYRRMGVLGNQRRVVLTSAEAEAVVNAINVLAEVFAGPDPDKP